MPPVQITHAETHSAAAAALRRRCRRHERLAADHRLAGSAAMARSSVRGCPTRRALHSRAHPAPPPLRNARASKRARMSMAMVKNAFSTLAFSCAERAKCGASAYPAGARAPPARARLGGRFHEADAQAVRVGLGRRVLHRAPLCQVALVS